MPARSVIVAMILLLVGCTAAADAPDASGCDPSEVQPGTGFPETRGDGAEAWALLWETSPWEVGQEVKVVWRMAGTGDFEVRAVGPEGEVVEPTRGPTSHTSSNWDRPGDEWGTFFNLPSEGCWQLEAKRSDAISTVTIAVTSA